MSGFAGTLGERVTLLVRGAARDDLGGASAAWGDGLTLWAAVRPDGFSTSDMTPGRQRFAITLRTTHAAVMAERLRWRDRVLRVRRVESDPADPERIVLRTEGLA